MRAVTGLILAIVVAACLAAGAMGYKGYADARRAAPELKLRAASLKADGRGVDALGQEKLRILILVEDPAFEGHRGIDLHSPGAGMTTLTQSLAKRLGFKAFRPGIRKIRQTGYAMGLESRLSKEEILTLWLDTVPMGHGPDGKWVTGFFTASDAYFGKPPAELTEAEFIELVAVPIAPGVLNPIRRGDDYEARVSRIARLVAGQCEPASFRDVWLEGCATSEALPVTG
ncbi:MAG: biosynthetic peptidoglycan transglycosylase [Hyphomonas sp.]